MLRFQVHDPKKWEVEVCCLVCKLAVLVHMDKIPIVGPQFGDPKEYAIYWFKFYCGNCRAPFVDVVQKYMGEVVAEVEYLED